MIGGTMGVGKTSVCQKLKVSLPNSVFLDGDWCWNMHPFRVTEETKAMVMDNICTMLNNFLRCSAFENVIFCWVMHEQTIIDEILSRLESAEMRLINISLTCTEDVLCDRLREDVASGIREEDVIVRSIGRLQLYNKLDTIKIDTTDLTIPEVVKLIMTINQPE